VQKLNDSILAMLCIGYTVMLGCCSVVLHYRLPNLVWLYNTGLVVGLVICVCALSTLSYLTLKAIAIAATDAGGVFAAIATYALTFAFYSYGAWETPIRFAVFAYLVWAVCLAYVIHWKKHPVCLSS
jgi:L-asparagine transporter-like permease